MVSLETTALYQFLAIAPCHFLRSSVCEGDPAWPHRWRHKGQTHFFCHLIAACLTCAQCRYLQASTFIPTQCDTSQVPPTPPADFAPVPSYLASIQRHRLGTGLYWELLLTASPTSSSSTSTVPLALSAGFLSYEILEAYKKEQLVREIQAVQGKQKHHKSVLLQSLLPKQIQHHYFTPLRKIKLDFLFVWWVNDIDTGKNNVQERRWCLDMTNHIYFKQSVILVLRPASSVELVSLSFRIRDACGTAAMLLSNKQIFFFFSFFFFRSWLTL